MEVSCGATICAVPTFALRRTALMNPDARIRGKLAIWKHIKSALGLGRFVPGFVLSRSGTERAGSARSLNPGSLFAALPATTAQNERYDDDDGHDDDKAERRPSAPPVQVNEPE
jgi:hypothetical protein